MHYFLFSLFLSSVRFTAAPRMPRTPSATNERSRRAHNTPVTLLNNPPPHCCEEGPHKRENKGEVANACAPTQGKRERPQKGLSDGTFTTSFHCCLLSRSSHRNRAMDKGAAPV
mmetsp:Transcript_18413/g.36380  ORF Transcript_18413/g.36380 Transcript_18413/m.36380 type:complete len:114 (-) Transcript_18413:205-546(-)